MEEIKVNLDNLTNEERETLLKLVEKGNKLNKRWRGKVNNSYYSISHYGEVMYNRESESVYDNGFYKIGNYFKTREEAEFAREKQLVYQKLKDYALEHNTEVIDWNNLNQKKCLIGYTHYDNELFITSRQEIESPNTVYFTSEKIARDAIKVIGEDKIKKYLFGVEE